MDLDLITNGSSIKENIRYLLTGKVSWIVLGYTTDQTLGIIETGDDSLEDMFEEFHGSKIMYGFASVIDPNTKLKKNLYIYWQGSGSSQSMKTKSVQHSNVIRELMKPIHVTITARDEQDLDLKDIMVKVAAASGSNYSFHNQEKFIFETQPLIKSTAQTGKMDREDRLKDIALLNKSRKEPVPIPNQKENKNVTNVEPSKEFRTKNTISTFPKPTSNYVKINPQKEIKSVDTKQKITYENIVTVKGENNTAERAKEERQMPIENLKTDDIQELSSLMNRKYIDEPFESVGTNYSKINPMEEIQKLREKSRSQKTESTIEPTSHTIIKCDAKEEISRLRRESLSKEPEPNIVSSSYKKIDPLSEIQELRKSSKFSDSDQNVSPSSNYKKINPLEELKSLRSTSSVSSEEKSISSNYEKVDPMKEILAARKSFESQNVTEDQKPVQRMSSIKENQSARQTFENIHKSKNESHKRISQGSVTPTPISQTVKTQNEKKNEEKIVNQAQTAENIYTKKNNEDYCTEKSPKETHHNNKNTNLKHDGKVHNQFVFEKNLPEQKFSPIETKLISPTIDKPTTKSAVAIYEYQANDADEISFDVNDLITDIELIDDGWWIGCNKAGIKGMFPANYVQLCDKTTDMNHNSTVAEANNDADETTEEINDEDKYSELPLTVIAQYTYLAQDNDEISFNEGDKIFNVNKIDEGWWEGETLGGEKGMFPSNYVTII